MRSPGINGEGELRGQPAKPGSPGKMAVKMECVKMECVYFFDTHPISRTFPWFSRTKAFSDLWSVSTNIAIIKHNAIFYLSAQ